MGGISDFATKKVLHGRFIPNDKFRFDCGFEVPAAQIYNLISGYPSIGTEVKIHIERFEIKTHKHEFKCSCGEVHNDE